MGTSLKRQFERYMVSGNKADGFTVCDPSTVEKLDLKLTQSLKSIEPFPFQKADGRMLNHFCIGSDPEFVLVPAGSRNKIHAAQCGLKPGLAVGCDQNQRLAELRGWPTHSAIEHVAGILSSLRWIWRRYSLTRTLHWRAGAFFDGDGIGGHVHFGRKRPNRELEVKALDCLATLFKGMELFNENEWNTRQQPDAHNNRGYGKLGDIRPQLHGYEYRTLPSWLSSPVLAFVVLTASKLVVLDPEMVHPWVNGVASFEEGRQRLLRLAHYFAGRDDDAWVLKGLLDREDMLNVLRGMAVTPRDFKPAWGLPTQDVVRLEDNVLLPTVIAPLADETREIQDMLTGGAQLTMRYHPATFRTEIPRGYRALIENFRGRGINYAGVGDLIHNMACHQDFDLELTFDRETVIPGHLYDKWSSAQKQLLPKYFPRFRVSSNQTSFVIDRELLTTGRLTNTRKFFFDSGLLPVWKINDVTADSFNQYKQANTHMFSLTKKTRSSRERTI